MEKIAMIMCEEEEELFVHLLEKECGYYRVILELTRSEHKKFSLSAPFSEILAIMKKKKILLSCIDEIEAELIPLKKLWHHTKETQSVDKKSIEDSLSDLEELMGEILALDEENQSMLNKYMQKLQDQQKKLDAEAR